MKRNKKTKSLKNVEVADGAPADHESDVELNSKTQRKKEMQRLQALGKELLEFSESELAKINLSPELLLAFAESKRIKSREALRRHMQFIGKLMRSEDIAPIEEAIQKKRDGHRELTQRHHQIEQWRDHILANGNEAVEEFLREYPHADRQWLNQVRRRHHEESKQGKPPASSRKLFAYIRDRVSDS